MDPDPDPYPVCTPVSGSVALFVPHDPDPLPFLYPRIWIRTKQNLILNLVLSYFTSPQGGCPKRIFIICQKGCARSSLCHLPEEVCVIFPKESVSFAQSSLCHVLEGVCVICPKQSVSCVRRSLCHVPEAVCVMCPKQSVSFARRSLCHLPEGVCFMC